MNCTNQRWNESQRSEDVGMRSFAMSAWRIFVNMSLWFCSCSNKIPGLSLWQTPPIFNADSFCCRIVLNILCIFATVRIFFRILSFFSFWDFFLPCKRAIICVGVAPECTSERKHKIHFLKHSSENGIRLRLYNTNNGCRIQVRHSKNKNVADDLLSSSSSKIRWTFLNDFCLSSPHSNFPLLLHHNHSTLSPGL